MEILVFVKQVPDDGVEVRLDPATGKPATGSIDKVANAFDTYALELAARYTEANGGKVTVAAMGPAGTDSTLKNLIAVGASKAYLFTDPSFETGDEASVACRLAQLVKKCEAENGAPFDLILCGKESTDEISGQVGARLAEELDLPFVSSVIEVAPAGDKLVAKQETEDGYIKFETAMPAVYTIAKPGYDPRYPNIKAKLAARKAVIPTFSAADAGVGEAPCFVECLGYTEPPKRQAGLKVQEKEVADTVAKAMEILIQDKVL